MIALSRTATLFAVLALATATAAQDLRLRDGPRCPPGQLAMDSGRGRIVAVGDRGDTHEWDGQRWLRRTVTGPVKADAVLSVFDPAARRTLVFSMRARLGSETWDYDGATWRQRNPTVTPVPDGTGSPALTFDTVRGRPLLVANGLSALQTWEWTGADWVQRQPPASPPTRDMAMLAFDSQRGRAVLFGGMMVTGVVADTWEWDGTTWLQRQLAVHPSARAGSAMAYDSGRQRIVLFGGRDPAAGAGGSLFSDVWEYDGISWQQITPAGPTPTARTGASLVPDPGSNELLLLGGSNLGGDLHDGFLWNGARWQPHAGLPAMPSLRISAAAWEPGTDSALMFGGDGIVGGAVIYNSETWRWNGANWALVTAAGPPARAGSVMWSDFNDTWLFGGSNGQSVLGDTWRWRGSTWTQRTTAAVPPARVDAAIAYDLARSRAVLFGGVGTVSALADTWTFDGTNWQLESPLQSPPARFGHALANDLVRNRIVLFGGVAPGSVPLFRDDTWEWDGATWIPITPAARPPASNFMGMEFDLQLGRIVLAQAATGPPGLRMFSYDGATWSAIPIASTLPTRFVQSPLVNRLGSLSINVIADAHVFELSHAPALAEPFGSGCGADPPALAARTPPRLSAADFGLEVVRAPAGAAVGILGGPASASLPVGPCTQLVSPVSGSVFLLANGGGLASLDLPIPGGVTLLGTTLFFQGAALDPTAPAGFTTTAGLRVVVGD